MRLLRSLLTRARSRRRLQNPAVRTSRSQARALLAQGWEYVDEKGGRLWELSRGGRTAHVITDVRIDPDGTGLLVKIESIRSTAAPSDEEFDSVHQGMTNLPVSQAYMTRFLAD